MHPLPHKQNAIFPAIAYIWLAFYLLAVGHSLVSPRHPATIVTAQAEEPAATSVD
jgi:hypothetical protein